MTFLESEAIAVTLTSNTWSVQAHLQQFCYLIYDKERFVSACCQIHWCSPCWVVGRSLLLPIFFFFTFLYCQLPIRSPHYCDSEILDFDLWPTTSLFWSTWPGRNDMYRSQHDARSWRWYMMWYWISSNINISSRSNDAMRCRLWLCYRDDVERLWAYDATSAPPRSYGQTRP